MDQIPQGQPTTQPTTPQAASSLPPPTPVQISPVSPGLTSLPSAPSKLKSPKLWIGAGVGLLIIVVVFALFTGKPELLPGKVPTEEEIAGCARLTNEQCVSPRFTGTCELVELDKGIKQCQAIGVSAQPPPAAEAPPATEVPTSEPQTEETAAARVQCEDLTQALCGNPRYSDRCEWGTSKDGKQQCQAISAARVAAEVPLAEAPPATEVPTSEPQTEETAAARVQCEDLTQALCGNPRYSDRCEWGTSKDGKQQCQAISAARVAAEAPLAEAPSTEQPQEEIAAASRTRCEDLTQVMCGNPRYSDRCEWGISKDGKQQCQAISAARVAAEAPLAEAPSTEQPQEEIAAASRTRCEDLTQVMCGNPRYSDRCEWGTSKDGKQQCQAKGRVAVQPAAAPPPAEESTPATEVPTSEPQTEETAAARVQCEDLTQALCGNPRYADRCEWVVTSKNGKPQSQCQPMQRAAAPPPAPPTPATQPQPPVEVYPVEEPKEKEKVEIVAISPQPVTPQPVTPQPVTSQPVTSQPVTSQPVTSQPVTSPSPKPKPLTSQPEPIQPSVPQPITGSNAQEEARIRDLENLVTSLQQQLASAQNSNNDAQINALNTQIANIIAEMNNLRQAAGQPVVVNVVAPPAPVTSSGQAAPAPAPAPAVSAPSSGGGTEIIAVAVKDAQKKKEKKIASTATAESDSASAPAVLDGSGAAGTAAGAASSASAASASSARAAHGAFIQGRTGPGILLYPIFVAAANGMYFLLRKKKR